MSMHEWTSQLYGVSLPGNLPEPSKIVSFVKNHIDVFGEEAVEQVSQSDDEATCFVEDYYDGDESGLCAFMCKPIEHRYVSPTTDSCGDEYIGMFAQVMFPWDNAHSHDWNSVNKEDVEKAIADVFVELYEYGPKFDMYDIAYYG